MVYIVGSRILAKAIYELGYDANALQGFHGNFCPCSGRSLAKRCPVEKHDIMFGSNFNAVMAWHWSSRKGSIRDFPFMLLVVALVRR